MQVRDSDRNSVSMIVDRFRSRFDPTFGAVEDYRLGPLPVPSTSIYSRTDGVVRWQVCLDVTDARHENVEVRGSHIGLGFNASALLVVADRLAQAEGVWRPFRAPRAMRILYPPAASWQSAGRIRHGQRAMHRTAGSRSVMPRA